MSAKIFVIISTILGIVIPVAEYTPIVSSYLSIPIWVMLLIGLLLVSNIANGIFLNQIYKLEKTSKRLLKLVENPHLKDEEAINKIVEYLDRISHKK